MFTPDERAHMSDVRHVFIGFEVAAVVGAVVGGILLARAGRRGREGASTLARGASIAGGAGGAAVAIVAGAAFVPLLLAFHEGFFPQGDFLFGPESNVIAM